MAVRKPIGYFFLLSKATLHAHSRWRLDITLYGSQGESVFSLNKLLEFGS